MIQHLTAANTHSRVGMMQSIPYRGCRERASRHQFSQRLLGTVFYRQILHRMMIRLYTQMVLIRLG